MEKEKKTIQTMNSIGIIQVTNLPNNRIDSQAKNRNT